MGNENTKPKDKLKFIDREVNSLRSSVRSTKRKIPDETRQEYIQSLAKFSNEASDLKGKVKELQLEQTQKNISITMNEILTKIPQESDLDLGAVETSSFVQLPINKRQATNKVTSEESTKKQRRNQNSTKPNYSTLNEIQDKLKTLRPQINVALENKDTTQLRVHQQTIKVLAEELDPIRVTPDTPIGDKKKKLDSTITTLYQKIGKAMREIKQNKTILKALEEINHNLQENDSLLKLSLKNNDSSTVKRIQDDLSAIKQRLSSIEVPDDTTKRMKMELLDRIKSFDQQINDIPENNSQSDLSKAQSNYEDIVKNIASGKSKDKDDTRVKLESLQSFINDIKEDDENSLKRKQQLLNNVKQSFSSILKDETNIQNDNSDNNPKKVGTNFKDINNLYSSWRLARENLKPESCSSEEYLKIGKILEDFEKSIEQTRQQFSSIHLNTIPTQLKKLNSSTPNLSSPKPMHPKFGSSLSVDHNGPALIKTKVKVYTLSTPEIQSINDQPVVLRNKKFYKDNLDLDSENRFSKIEEIKTQVNYVKEKFHESQQKQHLKNKLESYVEILENYVHHENQRTASNAKIVLADIQEMLKSMTHIQESMNATQQRPMSIEDSFENIVGIQEAVEKLDNNVSKFSGKKGDAEYIKIKQELTDCLNYLEVTKIPAEYDMIQQQKREIFNKITSLFDTLEIRCSLYDDPQVVPTRRKLGCLKEKVKRFSGAYQGVLYNTIETDLKKLLTDIRGTIENKDVAEEIIRDTEKHLQILEHRATKNQSFRATAVDPKSKREDEEKLIKLKNDLLEIKTAINTTPTNNGVEIFFGLKGRLDLVKSELDQLRFSLEDEEKQKDLYNEVETLKNVVESKIALGQQTIRQWTIEQDKSRQFEEELCKIEEKFKQLKPEIENFVGTTSDDMFYKLDESSIRLVLKMDKLQFPTGTATQDRKIYLLKEIYNYGEILDKRAKETENLIGFEREIHDIEKNFERYVKLDDLENLHSKLYALGTKITNTDLNENLLERKSVSLKKTTALLYKVDNVKKQVREMAIIEDQIAKTEMEVDAIKNKINTFIGIHADREYYQLDRNISDIFSKLDRFSFPEGSDFYIRKNKLLTELLLCRGILDKRAKATEVTREINKQLIAINNKFDCYKGTEEELKIVENDLKSVQIKIEQYAFSSEQKQSMKKKFEILSSEYSRLKKAKNIPSVHTNNYIGSTSFLADVQNNLDRNKIPQNIQGSTETQMADIQMDIDKMRRKVISFVDSDSSEEYTELENMLLLLRVRLRNLGIAKESAFYEKELALEKNIQECLNILDQRAQEADSIMEIERTLEQLGKTNYSTISDEEGNYLDEKLISLQVKLGKLNVNDDLSERKNICINRTLINLKQLKDKSILNGQSNSTNEFSASSV